MPLARTVATCLGLEPLRANRQLLSQLTQRRITQEHKNTLLGRVWLVARPLSLLALYVFVFGYIFEGKFKDDTETSRAAYALGVFLGLVVIHFITDVLALAPRCIADNESLVKRSTVALEVIPASILGAAVFHFAIGFSLCIAGLIVLGHGISVTVLWILPIAACLSVFGLGIAYFVAVLGAYVRDISQAIPVASMGLLFGSAVFYPIEKIPEAAWTYLKFNPILHFVDATRNAVLWGEPAASGPVLYILPLTCLAVYALGRLTFAFFKNKLADQI